MKKHTIEQLYDAFNLLLKRVSDLEDIHDKCIVCGKVIDNQGFSTCQEHEDRVIQDDIIIPDGTIICDVCDGDGGEDVGYHKPDWSICSKCEGKGYVKE